MRPEPNSLRSQRCFPVQDAPGIAMPSSNSTIDTVLGVWETVAAEIGGILDLGIPLGAGTDGTVVTSIDP